MPSGTTFPIGSTLVACSATDSHGNERDGELRGARRTARQIPDRLRRRPRPRPPPRPRRRRHRPRPRTSRRLPSQFLRARRRPRRLRPPARSCATRCSRRRGRCARRQRPSPRDGSATVFDPLRELEQTAELALLTGRARQHGTARASSPPLKSPQLAVPRSPRRRAAHVLDPSERRLARALEQRDRASLVNACRRPTSASSPEGRTLRAASAPGAVRRRSGAPLSSAGNPSELAGRSRKECARVSDAGRAAVSRWAILDSNQGPPPYQSGALTS